MRTDCDAWWIRKSKKVKKAQSAWNARGRAVSGNHLHSLLNKRYTDYGDVRPKKSYVVSVIDICERMPRENFDQTNIRGPALRTDESVRLASVLRATSARHVAPTSSGTSRPLGRILRTTIVVSTHLEPTVDVEPWTVNAEPSTASELSDVVQCGERQDSINSECQHFQSSSFDSQYTHTASRIPVAGDELQLWPSNQRQNGLRVAKGLLDKSVRNKSLEKSALASEKGGSLATESKLFRIAEESLADMEHADVVLIFKEEEKKHQPANPFVDTRAVGEAFVSTIDAMLFSAPNIRAGYGALTFHNSVFNPEHSRRRHKLGDVEVPNHTFIEALIDDAEIAYTEGFDGVIGMSLGRSSIDEEENLLDSLVVDGVVNYPIFGFWFSGEITSCGAMLTIGGIDRRYYRGSLHYIPVEDEHLWKFMILRMYVDDWNICDSPCFAILDTSCPIILGPESDILKLNALLNARPSDDGWYKVDCESVTSLPTIRLRVIGKTLKLEPKYYIFQVEKDGQTECYSGFKAESPKYESFTWRFGTMFLVKYFTAYDQKRRQIGFAEAVHGRSALERTCSIL
ncbi:cathepsin D [Clonorchis sinensis]|uniref:Cathepsin D n=1 Tax=Clonorchis sinensis TaxID=79923 RepID=G7YJR8_CLOSI|nr:cathepsin D [Clonorchis sinensis]